MGLFNRRPKLRIGTTEIQNRIRALMYDANLEDPYDMSLSVGCSELSEEVKEKEEDASELRVGKLQHLTPLIYAHAHLIAEGAVQYQENQLPDELADTLTDEMWITVQNSIEHVAFSSIIGSLSQLLDMGLITLPKKFKGVTSE